MKSINKILYNKIQFAFQQKSITRFYKKKLTGPSLQIIGFSPGATCLLRPITTTHCCNLSVATPSNPLLTPSSFPLPSTSFSSWVLSNSSNKVCLDTTKVNKFIEDSSYSLLNVNVRSLSKNYLTFRELVNEIPTDIIAVTETWHPYNSAVNLKDYHDIVIKVRENRKLGGGVALYVKKSLKFELHSELNSLKLETLELTGIKLITEKNIKTSIAVVYKPPNCNINSTLRDLEKVLKALGNEQLILAGDMNIDTSNKSNTTKRYLEKLMEHNMFQKTAAFTRVTAKTKSILDHVITNIIDLKTIVSHFCVADHQAVLACWGVKTNKTVKCVNTNKNNTNTEQITKNSINYHKTVEKIRKTDWVKWEIEYANCNVEVMYSSFENIIKKCIVIDDKKTKKQKKLKSDKPFITKEILEQKSKVEKARKNFLKKNNEVNEIEFKSLKKEYDKALRTARNEYYGLKLTRAGKNSKLIWCTINEILKRQKNNDPISKIIHNNSEITNSDEISETLSNYYKNAAIERIVKIKSNIPFTDFLDPNEKMKDFKLEKVTKMDTWRYIKTTKPKTSSGPDQLTSKLVNMAAPSLVAPLTIIINSCFKQGSFPSALKISKITPILKKKQAEKEPCNYRPVNQLSTMSKIIEKASVEQLDNHTKGYSDNHQYGYKKNHNTAQPILLTRHTIECELNKKLFVILIMIDLSIAFETICTNKILPAKLSHYGATEKTVEFFKAYFNERKHFVELPNGTKSKVSNLHNYSCVQGSTLGPKVYNYYTHDLKNTINKENFMICFADDTNLIMSGTNPNELIKKANIELKKINDYLTANKLIINTKKSSYILFKPKRKKVEIQEKLIIETTEITRVKKARYLGIIIDEKLNFKEQHEKLVSKLTEAVNALICVRNSINYRSKIALYNAIFKSHLEYCAMVYYDCLKKKQMDKLVKLQKKAIRLVFRAPIGAHTGSLFKLADVVPVKNLYRVEALKFVFKSKNELHSKYQPDAINELFKPQKELRHTRRADSFLNIRLPRGCKKGNALYSLSMQWNYAKESHKSAGNLFSLKKVLKDDIMESIEICNTRDCVICKKDAIRNYPRYQGD